MIQIPLRNRHGEVIAYATIDDEDAEFAAHRWHLDGRGYVKRSVYVDNRQQAIYLHRELLGLRPGDRLQADHMNRDKLDNRRTNLRAVTFAANAQNKGSRPGSTSRFRGVYWCKETGKWKAHARIAGQQFYLGRFDREEEAAEAASDFRAVTMPYSIETVAA